MCSSSAVMCREKAICICTHREVNNNNNSVLYLFTRWAQQSVANYRVGTQNKYNKQNKTHIKKTRQGKSNNNNNNNNYYYYYYINTGLSTTKNWEM
jgi:hypothetical protein